MKDPAPGDTARSTVARDAVAEMLPGPPHVLLRCQRRISLSSSDSIDSRPAPRFVDISRMTGALRAALMRLPLPNGGTRWQALDAARGYLIAPG